MFGIGLLVVALLWEGGTTRNIVVQATTIPASTEAPAQVQDAFAPPVDVEPTIVWIASGPAVEGIATHYGISYNGQSLGCGGVYVSEEPTIIAVGPSRDGEWPCGQPLRVCGEGGCIIGFRVDGCPGCGRAHVDLSEAGIDAACWPGTGACDVTIEAVEAVTLVPPPPEAQIRPTTETEMVRARLLVE